MILVSSTQRRGAEVVAENLAHSLKKAGWSADLVALRDSASVARIDAQALVEHDHGVSGLRLGVVRRVRRLIINLSPDIVVAGGGATLKYSVAALVGFRNPPKLVYSSIGEPGYWARSRRSRRIMTWLLSRTILVQAVSHATAKQLVDDFGVPENKVTVVHPGVADAMLTDKVEDSNDQLRVLYLGSLSTEKNPLAALDAVIRCASPLSVRFVGDGPLMTDLAELTSGRPNISLIGPVADVEPHLVWADVLVLTSLTEGLPGVVLEAAAHGLPVVSFDVGGVREAVEDGVSGYVVAPGDVPAVVERLDRLAGDPDLRRKMGVAARQKVVSEFLLSDSVFRFRNMLESLIAS